MSIITFFGSGFFAAGLAAFFQLDHLVRIFGKLRTGYAADLFHEFGHFIEILEIGFLSALDMLDVTPPSRFFVVSPFEPDPGHERLQNL